MKRSFAVTIGALIATSALLTACTVEMPDESARVSERESVSATARSEVSTSLTTQTPDTLPEPVEGDWQWNPYVFDLLSGEYRQSAEKLADAILSYEPSVTLEGGQAEVVCDNFAFEFPPAALVDLSVQGDEVKIDYRFDKDAHEYKLAEFERAVENVLNQTVKPEDSESIRALLLYEYVVNHVSYFNVDFDEEKDVTAYSALTRGVTICYGYADAFGYLLRQTGMEAHLYRGARSDGAEHGWCYAKVDGKWYHFDPTWECSNQKSRGYATLAYFGMNDNRRYQTLLRAADCGFGALEKAGETSSADDEMIPSSLYPCNGWSFDRETDELTCKKGTLKFQ